MVDFNKFLNKPKIEPHVTIDGVKVDVNYIPDKSITLDQYKTVRANSPGFEALIPKLNNEALDYKVKHCLENCRWESESTYDYGLKNHLVPELLKRIMELEQEVENLKDSMLDMGIAMEMME